MGSQPPNARPVRPLDQTERNGSSLDRAKPLILCVSLNAQSFTNQEQRFALQAAKSDSSPTCSLGFSLRALAAPEMPRERNTRYRCAAEGAAIHADRSEDQRSNLQVADGADTQNA